MSNRLQNIRNLLVFACFFSYALGAPTGNAENAQAGQSGCHVVVGALFPESGPASLIGERSRQAAQLALEKLPSEIQQRIEIRFEDTQMKPTVGLTATKRLIEDPKLVMLTGFGSELVGAIAPILESAKIPGVFATPDRRPIEGKRYLFRHWVDEEDMYRIISTQLVRRGLKRVAIIHSEIPAMNFFAEGFQKSAPRQGIEVALSENILPTEVDPRPVVTRVMQKKVDAVLLFVLPPQPSMFSRELRRFSQELPLFAYVNLENSREIAAAQGALEGVQYAGPRFEPWFVSDFEKRFHETPEFASGSIYDIIGMVGRALEQGACTREDVRGFIEKQSTVHGSIGDYGIQDSNDFRYKAHLKTISAGKITLLQME